MSDIELAWAAVLSALSPKRERYHELLAEAQLREGGERPS